MKKALFLSILFFSAYPGISQKQLPPFGKIDIADLELKSCPFEPEANAMNLFDVQEVEFNLLEYSARLTTERRVRIKIFNEKGYEHASIRIPYFSKKRVTKIKDLSGVIYNLDSLGHIVTRELEKKDFFKEKSEDNLGIINFTFPDVKPGSVIEFRYTKVEKNVIQIDPWILQDEIPTAYASAKLTTPSVSRIRQKIYGTDTIPEKREYSGSGSNRRTIRTYFKEEIKSFKSEPFMTSYKDNLLKVVFLLVPESNFFVDLLTSSQSLWKWTGSMILNSPSFGGQIRKKIPGTEAIIDSAKKITSISDKVGFIYESVQRMVPEKAEQTLYPNDIIEAWNNKTGNSAEINLILLNLLEKAGVTSYPLLISTRSNGKISTDFPSAGQFNGIDVVAGDSAHVFVMDASLKYQLYKNPPINIMNREAFLLGKEDMRWVTVADERMLLKQTINIVGSIDSSGKLKGTAINFYYDYAKSNMLDSTREDDDEEEKSFFNNKTQGLDIISSKLEQIEDDNQPLKQQIEFEYEPQNTGDFYFINPRFLFSKNTNPFTTEARNTDIDFGCNQQLSFSLYINIPDNYEIEQIPKSTTVRAPDSVFFFRRIASGDATHLSISQVFEIHESIFNKEQYAGIKEFFSRVYALMTEEVILKKKKQSL